MKTKLLTLVLALFVLILNPVTLWASTIRVTVDGEEVIFDQPPVNIEGRVYVPIRFVAEKMGWSVGTPSTEPDLIVIGKKELPCSYLIFVGLDTGNYSQTVDIFNEKSEFVYNLSKDETDFSFTPKNINNRVLLSVRDIAEILYADVRWDDSSRTVIITSKTLPKPPETIQPALESKDKEIVVPDTPSKDSQEAYQYEDFMKYQDEYEKELIKLVNEERKNAGLNEVVVDNTLMKTARWHAGEMIELNYFGHTSPALGIAHTELAKYFGYDGFYAGENCQGGMATAEGAVYRWMLSTKGHREHILNPKLEVIGVGYAYDENSQYKHYWTLFMGY